MLVAQKMGSLRARHRKTKNASSRNFNLGNQNLSRLVFNQILNEVLASIQPPISLSESQRESLYIELLHYFGLIGAVNECEVLENAWRDQYNRREMGEFIKAWLKRRMRKKKPEQAMII